MGPSVGAPVGEGGWALRRNPVDAEISPVQQAVGQLLDLLEGEPQAQVAGDGGLHAVDPAQVLRRDGLLHQGAGEEAEHHQGQQDRDPARRSERRQRPYHDPGGDEGHQVGDHLPPEDEEALLEGELAPHQEREVEQDAGDEEVEPGQHHSGGQELQR